MMSSVPQFIDIEDKIAGPLTWRQLLWMIGLGAVLLTLFNVVSTVVFFVLAVPIVLIFCALAFYRPNNQPLIQYVLYGFFFLFRPKIAVWERPVGQKIKKKKKEEIIPQPTSSKDKKVTLEELRDLARMVDKHGRL